MKYIKPINEFFYWLLHKYVENINYNMIVKFEEFISEGWLTNWRQEREGMKIVASQMTNSFDNFVVKLIEERIPFWFECDYKGNKKVGYLMNDSINGIKFDGFIINAKNTDAAISDFKNNILPNLVVPIKPGKIHIGRTDFSDLTKANDIEAITQVAKALKSFYRDKNLSNREITGSKYEARVSIPYLCDSTTSNTLIDYVF